MAHRHLEDEALIAGHLHALDAEEAAESADHLHACGACRGRAMALGAWLTSLAQEGDAEADLAFTPTRLAQQRERVLRRLGEAAGAERPARVLTFPMRNGAMENPSRWSVRRLVATAAAAGLVIGLAAGSLFSLSPRGRVPRTSTPFGVAQARPAQTGSPVNAILQNDEALLSEIDDALTAPRIKELQALDAFTPVFLEARASR